MVSRNLVVESTLEVLLLAAQLLQGQQVHQQELEISTSPTSNLQQVCHCLMISVHAYLTTTKFKAQRQGHLRSLVDFLQGNVCCKTIHS